MFNKIYLYSIKYVYIQRKKYLYSIKNMISKKIYLCSIKYICIQSKIFIFNENIFTLYFYFDINCVMVSNKKSCL